MNIELKHEREEDGRWIAEVPDLPGVMVYGKSRDEAISKVKALALRVLADLLNPGVVDSETERGLCGASMSQWPSPRHVWYWPPWYGSAGLSNVNLVERQRRGEERKRERGAGRLRSALRGESEIGECRTDSVVAGKRDVTRFGCSER